MQMCKALEERDKKIFAEINAQLAEKDARIRELEKIDAELASKNAELAEKDTRIRELEKMLAEKK